MSSAGELACTYACLLLHDDGIPITAEKIATVAKAAKVNMESYWPSLFAKLCEKKNVDDLIMHVGSGGGPAVAAPSAGGAAAAAAAPAAEVKKEDKIEESDDDNIDIMDLFG